MKKTLTVLLFFFVFTVAFASISGKANAIPAWSQKYHFSCSVCHTVFPNLNTFGRAFWRNGFRLPSTNGIPTDATQITKGLSLSNPWPIPIMVEGYAEYTHTNEITATTQTDQFSKGNFLLAYGGSFPISVPLSNSISFYILSSPQQMDMQTNISIEGLGWGFGVPSHLLNLKLGTISPAGPYFDRLMGIYMTEGPQDNLQSLSVGANKNVVGTLAGGSMNGLACSGCHTLGSNSGSNGGLELYGTPGYHAWYKIMAAKEGSSNATEYSYQLKEYMPVSAGNQLEFGYYGGISSGEQISLSASSPTFTDMARVNGIDADIANNKYELGATYMVQLDSEPYGPSGIALPGGGTQSTNGYNMFEVYGRYLFPQVGYGLMLSADYAEYTWRNEDAQEAYNLKYNSATCSGDNLYQNNGGYTLTNGCQSEGIQHALTFQVSYNLAQNAHLWADYVFTNVFEYNTFGAGIDIAL